MPNEGNPARRASHSSGSAAQEALQLNQWLEQLKLRGKAVTAWCWCPRRRHAFASKARCTPSTPAHLAVPEIEAAVLPAPRFPTRKAATTSAAASRIHRIESREWGRFRIQPASRARTRCPPELFVPCHPESLFFQSSRLRAGSSSRARQAATRPRDHRWCNRLGQNHDARRTDQRDQPARGAAYRDHRRSDRV